MSEACFFNLHLAFVFGTFYLLPACSFHHIFVEIITKNYYYENHNPHILLLCSSSGRGTIICTKQSRSPHSREQFINRLRDYRSSYARVNAYHLSYIRI